MDGLLNENTIKYIFYSICGIFLLVGTIFLILGFSVLEATEVGLDYSWVSKSVDVKIYENGLHFLGIGHSFIRFPKMVQTIEFSKEMNANRGPIQSRTSDGLEVILEISFQYVLDSSQLVALYSRYGVNYQNVFQNIAIDILTEEATKYTAYEFFWDRGNIKDNFQGLRSVDLPEQFENAIQESEVKKQDIKKAEAELNKVKVEVETKIKAADYQKSVTINLAQGEASSILQQNNAFIESLIKVQASQSEAYKTLKNKLNMTNEDLLKFIKSKLIKNYDGNNLALSITSPEPNNKTTTS